MVAAGSTFDTQLVVTTEAAYLGATGTEADAARAGETVVVCQILGQFQSEGGRVAPGATPPSGTAISIGWIADTGVPLGDAITKQPLDLSLFGQVEKMTVTALPAAG